MCGIAGHVSFGGSANVPAVEKVTAALHHRGPDDHGIWQSSDGICALGHRRLSIIDLSPLGHQPMIDPDTGNVIVFNGEIYNFQALRADLEAGGDRFRSNSDTEVILALYRRHGVECLSRLRGMFAFAVWDNAKRHLFIARDRVGKKPLHYAASTNGIAFASELHPLSRFPRIDRSIDIEALELYLQLQSVPAPWTIYRGIRKLPPAHYAIVDSSGLRTERYWNVDYRSKRKLSDDEAIEGLEEKLTEAVRLRMISDVPLGALLSGGVDSSVIVALMSRLSNQPVRTFSIGFEEEAFNELPYAKQAAEICETVHLPKIVSADVEAMLPSIARHYGEPYADSSAIPSFHVSRVAREQVTVVLNGDGGDELLGGYPRYALSDFEQKTSNLFRHFLNGRQLAELSQKFFGMSMPTRIRRKLFMRHAWPETFSAMMYSSFWNDADRADLLGRETVSDLLSQWRTGWFNGAIKSADSAIDRMLWFDNRTYLSDDLLVKMDIASMHAGLEARSPLLDHELIEFCAGLPQQVKVRGGEGKWLLKRFATKFFPDQFVYRKKMGFGIPLAEWLLGPLRDRLEGRLRDADVMQPLHSGRIGIELDEFLAGQTGHASRIWALLMYAEWRCVEATD